MINEDTTKGFVSATSVDGIFFLRFVIASHLTKESNIDTFWDHLNELANKIEFSREWFCE